MKSLSEFEMPWKLLISSFLIVLTSGFVTAELYLKHTTEMADGKEGMSLDDITIQFHGSEAPKLKQQVLGPMMKFFSETQDVSKIKVEEREDIDKIVAWVEKGAPKDEYEFAEKEDNVKRRSISFILNMRGCTDCHAADSTMKGNKHDVPLETYEQVAKFAQKNPKPIPIDKGRLLSLSHIHLLGMGMMFMLAGAAVASTLFPKWVRSAVIIGGHASILLDIFGWWGVREVGASLSWVVMLGGILMVVSFILSVMMAFWDMWIRRPKSK